MRLVCAARGATPRKSWTGLPDCVRDSGPHLWRHRNQFATLSAGRRKDRPRYTFSVDEQSDTGRELVHSLVLLIEIDRSTMSMQAEFNKRSSVVLSLAILIVSLGRIPTELRLLRSHSSDRIVLDTASKGSTGQAKAFRKTNFTAHKSPRRHEKDVDKKADTKGPKIALLMSFPNSGTSYTILMLRHLSATFSASNYGLEKTYVGSESSKTNVAIRVDQPQGPFWMDAATKSNANYTYPADLVLTKTHCGGKCVHCPPKMYIESPYSFRRECLTARKIINSTTIRTQVYPTTHVQKAIHLFRDPVNNVVSRFHHERRSGRSAVAYPATREGFRDYCKNLDGSFETSEVKSTLWDKELRNAFENVPCRAEFVRYVLWHDLTFWMTRDMEIETFILRYEWYESRLGLIASKLVRFLDLKPVGDLVPFVAGKKYHDYFSPREHNAIASAIHMSASSKTWEVVKEYFRHKIQYSSQKTIRTIH
jgi:hypothetical protein